MFVYLHQLNVIIHIFTIWTGHGFFYILICIKSLWRKLQLLYSLSNDEQIDIPLFVHFFCIQIEIKWYHAYFKLPYLYLTACLPLLHFRAFFHYSKETYIRVYRCMTDYAPGATHVYCMYIHSNRKRKVKVICSTNLSCLLYANKLVQCHRTLGQAQQCVCDVLFVGLANKPTTDLRQSHSNVIPN